MNAGSATPGHRRPNELHEGDPADRRDGTGRRSVSSYCFLALSALLLVAGVSLFDGTSLPGMRLNQLAHELGHMLVSAAVGNEVQGVVLDPGGAAAAYTSLDLEPASGARAEIIGMSVLSAGVAGEAVFAAALLVAVRRMRTGRTLLLTLAVALAAVTFLFVPGEGELPAQATVASNASSYTWAYSMVTVVVLLSGAMLGGVAARATTYVLVTMAFAGVAGSVRELWLPAQHPTDADLAATLTSLPVNVWRASWTIGAAVLVGSAAVRFVRSANGWPVRYLVNGDASATPSSSLPTGSSTNC